jgi:large subunit ribosomal protein L29
MYIREIREMNDQEILDRIEDLKEATFNFRFQKATGQLEDTNAITKVRRDIARLKMVLRERQLAAQLAQKEGDNA